MENVQRAIEAAWRADSTRLIAAISRVTRDVGIAEELAQDALVAALERWPVDGIPVEPCAWLMTTAKRRAIDNLRRGRMIFEKHQGLAFELEQQQEQVGRALDQALDNVIDDDILRLIFTACHPALPIESRLALALRTLCGLTTAEIARAFLVPEKTIGQRIYRAKRTLAQARVPFEAPRGKELPARVSSVLVVVYLLFNEGYTATSGEEWMRSALSDEALRLARLVVNLLPSESEAHALLALIELGSSRNAARRGVDGQAILLPDQDRALWDRTQMNRGMAALAKAESLGGAARPYALQAAIAACHMQALTAADTDWHRIVQLYDVLARKHESPVVSLNRTVAIGMAHGAAAGLAALDKGLMSSGQKNAEAASLLGHHLFHSVRGDLLEKLGRFTEAAQEFRRAMDTTKNVREQELLARRLIQVESHSAK